MKTTGAAFSSVGGASSNALQLTASTKAIKEGESGTHASVAKKNSVDQIQLTGIVKKLELQGSASVQQQRDDPILSSKQQSAEQREPSETTSQHRLGANAKLHELSRQQL